MYFSPPSRPSLLSWHVMHDKPSAPFITSGGCSFSCTSISCFTATLGLKQNQTNHLLSPASSSKPSPLCWHVMHPKSSAPFITSLLELPLASPASCVFFLQHEVELQQNQTNPSFNSLLPPGPSPLIWHVVHHKPSAPFTSGPSEACSLPFTSTPSCSRLFLRNIQETQRGAETNPSRALRGDPPSSQRRVWSVEHKQTHTGTHRDRVLPLELLKAVYQDRETSPHSPNNKTVRKETFRSLISGAPGACPHREGGGEGRREGWREEGGGR